MVKNSSGFSILELMAVVAILGIVAALALPSYGRYKKKTNRTNMMADLQLISSELENLKQTKGGFKKVKMVDLAKYLGGYPKNNDALYSVNITSDKASNGWKNPIESNWKITATPIAKGFMHDDGSLSLNYQGIKCRNLGKIKRCGSSDEWRQD